MASGRGSAATAFLEGEHRRSQLTEAEKDRFVATFMQGVNVTVRLPTDTERINSFGPRMVAIPIDHFGAGFAFPVFLEYVEVLEFYGVVPGQIAPNSVASIMSFLIYLRSQRVSFTMNLFRNCFEVRAIPIGKKENKVFLGNVYFGCKGMKVVNLPNKIPGWSTRYLMFEGELNLLPTSPRVRPASRFLKFEVQGIERDIAIFLADTRLDIRNYIPMRRQVADYAVAESRLRVPANKPETPDGLQLTQSEARKQREVDRRERNDPAANYETDPFPLIGQGEKVKDLKGKPVVRWDVKGKSVKVSTALPSWRTNKPSTHARAVTHVMYGKKGLAELQKIAAVDLPMIAAHARANSLITDHFMGETFLRTLEENENLETENEQLRTEVERLKVKLRGAYDLENPAFQAKYIMSLRAAGAELIEDLRKAGQLIEDEEDEDKKISFDKMYPGFDKITFPEDPDFQIPETDLPNEEVADEVVEEEEVDEEVDDEEDEEIEDADPPADIENDPANSDSTYSDFEDKSDSEHADSDAASSPEASPSNPKKKKIG